MNYEEANGISVRFRVPQEERVLDRRVFTCLE